LHTLLVSKRLKIHAGIRDFTTILFYTPKSNVQKKAGLRTSKKARQACRIIDRKILRLQQKIEV